MGCPEKGQSGKLSQNLLSPRQLIEEYSLSCQVSDFITESRIQVREIIAGRDPRLLLVLGPCSIHDCSAALDYASHLQKARERYGDDLFIVMRIYFEKPRTTVGWTGLINDPDLNGQCDINKGLRLSRELLLAMAKLHLPAGTEFLDPVVPQYLQDLVSWGAIGARTVESQLHRQLASGLEMPVGFKNSTSGEIQTAIDGIAAARHSHHYLSINEDGGACVMSTSGNQNCHLILRGGREGPNYSSAQLQQTFQQLQTANLAPFVMIDCSHGNCNKDHLQQYKVGEQVAAQVAAQEKGIMGVMLESNLLPGRQQMGAKDSLIYGQSVTDACISWHDTERLLEKFACASRERRARQQGEANARTETYTNSE